MSYTIVRTDGSTLTIIPDGVVNTTSTPLYLPGRNYSSYGVVMDTNFVHQLENFADSVVPSNPLRGQFWFNTTDSGVYVCPTDGETDANNWIKLYATNGQDLEAGNLTLTGNLYANNAFLDNELNANHVIANYLTVNVSANILDATLSGNSNISNIKTNSITTGSNATAGSLVGNWSLDGNLNVTTGNLMATGVKTDTYMYANGEVIDFLKAAGSDGYIQYNDGGNLAADSGLTYDSATHDLSVQGNITGDDITSTGVFTGVATGLSAIPAANVQGVLPALVQTSITQLGTLSSLTVTGNISTSRVNVSGNVYATYLSGTLITPSQPNITTVGTLNSLSVTGNITSGNVSGGNLVSANFLTGTLITSAQPNITSVGTLTSLDVTGNIIAGNVSGGNLVSASYLAGTLTTAAQPNITSLGTLTSLNVTGNVSAANVTANLFGNGIGVSSVAGANVVGAVSSATTATTAGSATTAGTVTTAAQPNITSVGALTSLTVNGNIASGNIVTGTISGDGSKLSAITGANVTGFVANASFATTATTASSATTANIVTDNAQPGITSVGTLTSLDVTGNVTGANITGAHYGNGAGLANIAGSNVLGQVANALVSGTVYTSAQPNITSVGTLNSLTVSGNVNVANLIASSYVVGNGSKLTNLPGGNVVGKVANAVFADNTGFAANAGNAINAQNANYANFAGTLVGVVSIQNGGTSSNTSQGAGVNLGIIGVGQTWQNVTSSRALGTDFTNTTGRPIMVYVKGNAGSGIMTAYVNSIEVASSSAGGHTMAVNFLVPAGNSYKINYTANTLATWSELR